MVSRLLVCGRCVGSRGLCLLAPHPPTHTPLQISESELAPVEKGAGKGKGAGGAGAGGASTPKGSGKDEDTPSSRRKRIEEMQAASGSGVAAPVSPPGERVCEG